MKRRWKIALGVVAALAILLAVNTITTGSQTKQAEVTVEGGQIIETSRGDVQVTDTGPPAAPLRVRAGGVRGGTGQPIVLIHCYACSLRWFDRIEPLLAERHRVIRVDLLGFGGSEKPESGYDIPGQAATVAEALNALDVDGALVAGNSMGAMVVASLAEQASQLVDRAVVIDMAPNTRDFGGGQPFLAKVSYVPVLGEAIWRVTPDFAVRSSYDEAFAPGFDAEAAFDDPDQVLADYEAMTYTSYDDADSASDDYLDEQPLDERFKQTPVPLLVIFGAEDQVLDADLSVEGFADVPGVRTEIVEDAGHAPHLERPDVVAELLEDFAVEQEPAAPRRPAKPRKETRQRPDRAKPGDGKRAKRDGKGGKRDRRR